MGKFCLQSFEDPLYWFPSWLHWFLSLPHAPTQSPQQHVWYFCILVDSHSDWGKVQSQRGFNLCLMAKDVAHFCHALTAYVCSSQKCLWTHLSISIGLFVTLNLFFCMTYVVLSVLCRPVLERISHPLNRLFTLLSSSCCRGFLSWSDSIRLIPAGAHRAVTAPFRKLSPMPMSGQLLLCPHLSPSESKVLYLGWCILGWFLYPMRLRDLISVFSLWITCFPSLSSTRHFLSLCEESDVYSWIGSFLTLLYSSSQHSYFHASVIFFFSL